MNPDDFSLDSALDLSAGILLMLGAFLSLAAGVGLLRFPDALSRLHAATKPQILGLILVVMAVAIQSRSLTTLLALLPVILFQLLTAPISAHMVGRAGYRTRTFTPDALIVDELAEAVERATDEEKAVYRDTPGGGSLRADPDADSSRL